MEKETQFKKCLDPNCRRRGELLSLNEFYRYKGGRYGRRAICKECYHIRYGDKYKLCNERRKENLENGPNTLTKVEEHLVLSTFDNKCALKGSEVEVSLDHFVPISWNEITKNFDIGGNTYANMLPLNIELNKSKSDHNPFLWFKDAKDKFNINMDRWKEAVAYVAEKHGMTPLDFENRVNQCYENVMVKRAIYGLNKRLKEKRKKPPYSIVTYLLRLGINIDVAIDKYGNKKAKQFVRNEEIVENINKIKKTLTKEVGGN
ncbi:hypothetical protein ABE288_20565 [Bacillus salipaludis]|uniref:hypothetical protein n=1 Tax=Bacillus salipaludis TaxID=2547811 RepID=UPI003D1B8CC8